MPIPAYVINRPQDSDRLARFRSHADRWDLDVRVVAAIDGHAEGFSISDHAHAARNGWSGRPLFKPGAFACFLSHVMAWRLIAEGTEPHAFVFEDDAVIGRDPARIHAVVGKADLAYANKRMARWTPQPEPFPIEACFRDILGRGVPLEALGIRRAFGGDCYWLTRKGAEALLAQFERHGACFGVDYFIASVALPRGTIPDPLPEHLRASLYLQRIARIAPPSPVKGYILGNWIGRTAGESVIRHDVRVRVEPGPGGDD